MDQTGKTILIVDDEPALLKMMSVYLTRKGFVVRAMDSTDRAWTAVEGATAGLAAAVIDASISGLTAEELALRLLATNSSMCVLIASGYPVDMSRVKAAGHGRVEFMQKPFSGEMLNGALRRMIASQEKDL